MKLKFGKFKGVELRELPDWYLKSLVKYRDTKDPVFGEFNQTIVDECNGLLEFRATHKPVAKKEEPITPHSEIPSPPKSLTESYLTEVLLRDLQKEIDKIYETAKEASKKIENFSFSKKKELPGMPY